MRSVLKHRTLQKIAFLPGLLIFVAAFVLIRAGTKEPSGAALASYPPDQTGLQAVSIQPLAQPGYLQTVTDPTVGNMVMRVSDQTAFGTSNLYLTHSYAKVTPWNADESMLFLYDWAWNT